MKVENETVKDAFISFLKDEGYSFQVDGDDIAVGDCVYQFGNKGQYIGQVQLNTYQ